MDESNENELPPRRPQGIATQPQETIDLWVDPGSNVEKVELFGGQYWIEVRKVLTAGQQLAIQQAAVSFVSSGKDGPDTDEDGTELSNISNVDGVAGAKVGLNMARMNIAKVLAYLVDWNFTAPGKTTKVPITRTNLEALNPRVFQAIMAAIDATAQVWKGQDGPPQQTRTDTAPSS